MLACQLFTNPNLSQRERIAALEFTIEILALDAERFELTKAGLANICSAIDIQCYQLRKDVP